MFPVAKSIGQRLVESGKLDKADLELATRESEKSGERLIVVLQKMKMCGEADALEALSHELGMRYVELASVEPSPQLVGAIPAKLVNHYKVFPVALDGDAVVVATSNPFDMHAFDDLRMALHLEIEPALATSKDIAAAIKKYYGIGAETIQEMEREAEKDRAAEKGEEFGLDYELDNLEIDADSEANDATIVRFVNQFTAEAIRERATDIHVEPFEESLRIRYRIDGRLYEAQIPPAIKRHQSAIISRLKIMAHLDIAERRLPQDGKIKLKMNKQDFDLRVSTVPTPYGESLSIRILTRDSELVNLGKLGLSPENLQIMREMIAKPHGVILVTGPTGSGKSTTLYASLSELNDVDKKIITIEDPIEYRMPGITQIQVHPDIGLTFARALRTILRQDPDIIMVGETRDAETAQNTIRAALTGHLVFSTLHTNDALSAFNRLIDMGIEPFLVTSSVEGVLAQRLVRTLCKECKAPAPIEEIWRYQFGLSRDELSRATPMKPIGCEKCRYSGYRGRTAIYEIARLDETLKQMIMERETATALRKHVIKKGMRSIRRDGWTKIRDGFTTADEVLRVTMEEEFDAVQEPTPTAALASLGGGLSSGAAESVTAEIASLSSGPNGGGELRRL